MQKTNHGVVEVAEEASEVGVAEAEEEEAGTMIRIRGGLKSRAILMR